LRKLMRLSRMRRPICWARV